MKLSSADLAELADLAIRAATEAGQMVARSRPQDVQHKEGGVTLASQVVTEIDHAAEVIIVDILSPTLESHELGLLTEETADDGGRLTADYFWCIDPIDGTLPFIEGKPGYSVSIGLVRRDGVPQIGVVYDPVEATLYHAVSGVGIFRDGEAMVPPIQSEGNPGGEELSVFTTGGFLARDDHDDLVDQFGEAAQAMDLTGARIEVGSGAVMKACAALVNAPACFVMFPGPTGASLWDFAATACLFAEADAVAMDFDGAPLDLNRSDATGMSQRGVLMASDQVIAEAVRELPAASSWRAEESP